MGVGRRLREARDSKGLTLTALAERTKIPARQLSLLEQEEYGRLPGGIFARGYVRAVAIALGLDPDRTVDEFRREQQPTAAATTPDVSDLIGSRDEGLRLRLAPEVQPDEGARPNGRMLAFVVIAVSVILVILWLRRDGPALPDAEAERPASAVEATVPERLVATTDGAVGTTGTMRPRVPAQPDGPLVVRIDAEAPCWVTLQADGRRVAYRLLQAGDSVTAEATQEIVLRTGHAAALQLTINGRRAQRIGSSGEVRTIQITPGNYRTVLGAS